MFVFNNIDSLLYRYQDLLPPHWQLMCLLLFVVLRFYIGVVLYTAASACFIHRSVFEFTDDIYVTMCMFTVCVFLSQNLQRFTFPDYVLLVAAHVYTIVCIF